MNEILVSNLREHYTPVALDNFGSHRAARRWLTQAGMPLEEALVLLRRQVARFDLSKARDGKPPVTLGYFTKTMLREWDVIQREREQLALLPSIDMTVERVGPPITAHGSTMLPKEPDVPPASPEEVERYLAEGRSEWERIAGMPTIPGRI